jgi:hypothetical protein
MKLIQLYESILKTANLHTTNDGYVSLKVGDIVKPTMLKGKRLVLPTKEHLSNPNKEEIVLFHPLSENILKGESAVLEEFRSSLNARLNHTIGLLSFNLLVISTSIADHVKLSPDQSEFLSNLKNADDKTLEVFQKLLKVMPVDQHQNSFISIYLKRGGSVNGKRHSRVGIVSFPFYEELKKDGDVYGVKLRVKDRETFISLMDYMFPTIDEPESFNRGSDSDVAPYLDSLMKAVMAVASPINDQVALFKNIIEDSDELMIEDGWVDTFDNLGSMINEIRMVPMQAGNEGSSKPGEQQVLAKPLAAVTPVATPLPAVLMAGSNMYQQQPVMSPMYQGMPPNGYVQPNMPEIKTANGINFDALLRLNPALGGAPQVMGGYNPHQYGMPPQRAGYSNQPMNNGWNNNNRQYGGYNSGGGI